MDYELYHYGVKGMKWGVRRYQNKDGSLTALGKQRSRKDDGLVDKKGYLTRAGHLAQKQRRQKLTSAQSDAELKRIEDADRRYTEALFGISDKNTSAAKAYSAKHAMNDLEIISRLTQEILDYSVDWYFADPHTEATKKVYSDHIKPGRYGAEKYVKSRREFEDDLAGAVATDLGYKNTPEARRILLETGVIIWD